MREIKFRAWDKGTQTMFDVQDISFGKQQVWSAIGEPRNVEFSELMQFTGFKDKNGTDIYEGDVLLDTKHGEIKRIVRYGGDGLAAFTLCFGPLSRNDCANIYEVIGDIYHNQDLLKEAQ